MRKVTLKDLEVFAVENLPRMFKRWPARQLAKLFVFLHNRDYRELAAIIYFRLEKCELSHRYSEID